MSNEELVEKFQCPGCVCGSDTNCGKFKWDEERQKCTGHVIGTLMSFAGHIALGLPRGFCRPGYDDSEGTKNIMPLRLWKAGTKPEWDHLNVAVWAKEDDGFLFVRTYMPRLNYGCTDVIEGGTPMDVPAAIDAGKFESEID